MLGTVDSKDNLFMNFSEESPEKGIYFFVLRIKINALQFVKLERLKLN